MGVTQSSDGLHLFYTYSKFIIPTAISGFLCSSRKKNIFLKKKKKKDEKNSELDIKIYLKKKTKPTWVYEKILLST